MENHIEEKRRKPLPKAWKETPP